MSATLPRHSSLAATARALAHALDPSLWARDVLGFHAEPWQTRVLRSTASRVGLNCTRQAGKSTIAAVLALHGAVHEPGSLVLLAAPSLRQSGELHRKTSAFLARLSPRVELVEDNASTLSLASGSRIACIPSTEATSRGYSAPSLVVLDEAARIPDESIAALRPMLASGRGRLLMLSTPAGQRGAFFQAAHEHRADWEWHTVPAKDIARISPQFLEAERRALGPRAYQQEYECRFMETDAAMFDLEQIRACIDPGVPPLFSIGGSAGQQALLELLSSSTEPLGVA